VTTLQLFQSALGKETSMRSAGIAAIASVAIALGLNFYDCQTGTHEQCLMSTGLLWGYWIVAFLLTWLVVASISATIRFLKNDQAQR
jgi:hypothetical protein